MRSCLLINGPSRSRGPHRTPGRHSLSGIAVWRVGDRRKVRDRCVRLPRTRSRPWGEGRQLGAHLAWLSLYSGRVWCSGHWACVSLVSRHIFPLPTWTRYWWSLNEYLICILPQQRFLEIFTSAVFVILWALSEQFGWRKTVYKIRLACSCWHAQ